MQHSVILGKEIGKRQRREEERCQLGGKEQQSEGLADTIILVCFDRVSRQDTRRNLYGRCKSIQKKGGSAAQEEC